MKILHTSDWHLGRTLRGHLLFDAQESAVNHIVDAAISHGVAAVIIAGDTYDRPSPPPESIRLLNSAITRLDAAGIAVVISAGNHDSADRLSTYASVLKPSIRIAGSVWDAAKPLELFDEHGPVLIYPITYLHPDVASYELAPDPENPLERQHEAVMRAAVELAKDDLRKRELASGKKLRSIVVAHAFVGSNAGSRSQRVETDEGMEDSGLQVSESERDLSIGGIQIVPVSVFDGFSYIALGHLHGQQNIKAPKGSQTKVRYSGSLLRYSMSERNHVKSFTILEFGADHELTPEQITVHEIPQPRGMARIAGSMDELLGANFQKNRQDFVEVTVTDSKYPNSMYPRIKEAYPHLVNVIYNPENRAQSGGVNGVRLDARKTSPLEAMTIFFEQASGAEVSDKAKAVLAKAISSANEKLRGK